jgi:hypothetical protein
MAIFAMEGSSTPSTEVKTPLLQASNSSSRLQHYLSSAAGTTVSSLCFPFSFGEPGVGYITASSLSLLAKTA